MKVAKFSSSFIRETFLDYFKKYDHTFVRSSPVVPLADPTLSFVNAGMNQFKNILLGKQSATYPRVVNSQKCIRVGGKHNDLSVVGFDTYHHTFFEMLGSWSFGDYFKEKACRLAWQFLTTPPISIPPDRLFVTYFEGDEKLGLSPDLETLEIWRTIGVSKDRILPFGIRDNFWEMDTTGPCGSCTEIHYDYLPNSSSVVDRSRLVNKGSEHLIELWNLVFIEYNRLENGSLVPLPVRHIDTGLGFERFVAVMQGKSSNYDTDIFLDLFRAVSKFTGAPEYCGRFGSFDRYKLDTAYRIIADHTRMCAVALADNMFPDSNHKLRRTLRKALLVAEKDFKVKHDYKLLNEIVNIVAKNLSPAYPEIGDSIKKIHYIIENESSLIKELKGSTVKEWQKITKEDKRLANTFTGLEAVGLPAAYNELMASIKTNEKDAVNADLALKLYDTYGLDVDLIEQLVTTTGYNFYKEEFTKKLKSMKDERKKKKVMTSTRSSLDFDDLVNGLKHFNISPTDDHYKYDYKRTDLNGKIEYEFPEITTRLQSVICLNGGSVNFMEPGKEILLKNDETVGFVLDKTNFYSTAGGQTSDTGHITIVSKVNGSVVGLMNVEKVVKYYDYVLHIGKIKILDRATNNPILAIPEEKRTVNVSIDLTNVDALLTIDKHKRLSNMRNHTTTHLINSALHNLLTVTCQKSSNVNSDHLIFDFATYNEEFNRSDYIELENKVNKLIKSKLPVERKVISLDKLLSLTNVTLLPGEVYPNENILLIKIKCEDGFVSQEPCCGTHVSNTGDIDEFRIINVKSKGTNVKSLKAVTGVNANVTIKNDKLILDKINQYKNLMNDLTNRKIPNVTDKMLNDFDVQLQNLRNELITSVDNKYFSYSVFCNAIDSIDDYSRELKKMARVMLMTQIELEMKNIVNSLNLKNVSGVQHSNKFIVHFIKSSSILDPVSLNKVTKMCPPNIPTMLFSYSESDKLLKGRCCIPKEMADVLAANKWMLTVCETINSAESVIKGQDPKLVCGMKPKKIKKEELEKTVEVVLQKAETTVKSVLKR